MKSAGRPNFFNHRLQWNGAVYRENWNNVQVAFFDPGLVGNIFYNTNGQNFLVKGVETSLVARVTDGLTLQGAASWNQSRQTNSPALIDTNPASVNFGKPITVDLRQHRRELRGRSPTRSDRSARRAPIRRRFNSACVRATNGPSRPMPLRAGRRRSHRPFIHASGFESDHRGKRHVSTGRLRFENPAYTTYDASIGVAKDAWNAPCVRART